MTMKRHEANRANTIVAKHNLFVSSPIHNYRPGLSSDAPRVFGLAAELDNKGNASRIPLYLPPEFFDGVTNSRNRWLNVTGPNRPEIACSFHDCDFPAGSICCFPADRFRPASLNPSCLACSFLLLTCDVLTASKTYTRAAFAFLFVVGSPPSPAASTFMLWASSVNF